MWFTYKNIVKPHMLDLEMSFQLSPKQLIYISYFIFLVIFDIGVSFK